MRAPALAALLAAVLLAPVSARAAGALKEARGASADSSLAFDGARVRPETDAVKTSSSGDRRTRLASSDKAGGNLRRASGPVALGEDREIEPPQPREWLKSEHIILGATGAIIGALIGSLGGLPGAAIGLLIGGLIGYGVSRLKA